MRLATERLLLRPWDDRDRPAWAAMSADPAVRRYYWPAILSRDEADAVIEDCRAHLEREGFGFLAAERIEDGALIGGVGLSRPGPEVPTGHEVELGFILGSAYWRLGYALESATACLTHAFGPLGAGEVVGYTSRINTPSRRLMERLGMATDPADDFEDGTVPEGNPLRPHVLYRISPASRR